MGGSELYQSEQLTGKADVGDLPHSSTDPRYLGTDFLKRALGGKVFI